MTEILQRRRRERVAARLPERLSALGRALDLAEGRAPDEAVAAARQVVDRAGQRLALSPDHTIIALAGSTGSGKSSLFNALVELDIATVGVRRPTTSAPLACIWGAEGASDLLDWLGIDRRHQVMRSSVLEDADATDLRGLVLLDLPDHDSTEVGHRLEVRRLVDLVDMIIWVMDPQKYADSALHDDFLRPLASHAGVMAFVLNQSDRLSRAELDLCRDDLGGLLERDGFGASPLVVTSARTGAGVSRLRAVVAERVLARQSFAARVGADVDASVERLAEHCGTGDVADPTSGRVAALRDGLAQASGVDAVASAVRRSYESRAAQATGWPPVRWIGRFRPDPLRRLGLNKPSAGSRPDLVRTSLPAATPVQRAQVDTSVRRFAESTVVSLPPRWADAIRRAAWSRSADLPDAVDSAIARTDLEVGRTPGWWRAVSVVQWILLTALVVGVGWLALLAVGTYVGLPDVPTPEVFGIGLPLLLAGGGALLGIVVALAIRPLRRLGARRLEARAAGRLRQAVGAVGEELVVAPVRGELARLREVRSELADAARAR